MNHGTKRLLQHSQAHSRTWTRLHAKTSVSSASLRSETNEMQSKNFHSQNATTMQQVSTFDPLDAITTGTNASYLEYLEEQWTKDPQSVDVYWRQYFESIASQGTVSESLRQRLHYELSLNRKSTSPHTEISSSADKGSSDPSGFKSEVMSLVRAFQVNGHAIANLDPLGIYDADLSDYVPAELLVENYHFNEADMNRTIQMDLGGAEMKGFLGHPTSQPMKLHELITNLKTAYCDTIGVEYMHIMNRDQCNWIRERVELPQKFQYSIEDKKVILDRLMFSDSFELFLSNKFPTAKRFGLEGLESFIPGIKASIDTSADLGVEHVIIGMAHRGRLNLLANVLRKPMEIIFSEFLGTNTSEFGSGDVKYHLGASSKRSLTHSDSHVSLTLCANPSHLEAVDPVVMGKARAKQFHLGDKEGKKVLPILVHGDASFAGQGVVFETMEMSNLHDYSVGGTIHIVTNNQIGFTTNPRQSRSTPYCTDLAKFISAPILHVNADDVEAVVRCCQIAAEWRQTFGKDIIVDIVGFRKHGHNELDQPMFTQPIMYTAIAKHKPALQHYTEKLVKENVVSEEKVNEMHDRVKSIFDKAFERSKEGTFTSSEWLGKESNWRFMQRPGDLALPKKTGVSMDALKQVGQALTTYPSDFNINRVLKRILDQKAEMINTGHNIDWATGEALAFGTLLNEGHHVRLSGQDAQRGTFSHRHSVLVDQKEEKRYCMLNNISSDQAHFHVMNSHLSEYGVLGFEYGYSLEHPDNLVLWEAQFGDFANGAQIIIDQFIASGEQKWLKMSGLVMLLPHGYEGQGPEHSSARLERFLQMSDEAPHIFPEDFSRQIQNTNYQVCNITTPANYFHVLRRQLKRDFRKPLVIVTPKSLLRHRSAVSSMEDFAEGTTFQKLIPEHDTSLVAADKIRRLVFCTGKVYYDLLAYREQHKIDNVAIVRIEQLAPFPFDLVAEQLKMYPNAEVMWTQEEPVNQGAWNHFYFRCLTSLRHTGDTKRIPTYVGRAASASPSTGFPSVHTHEQEKLVKETFE